MIQFKEEKLISPSCLNDLYSSVGWTAYTKDLSTLEQAIAHSFYVRSAWDGTQLIGLIRAISDGKTILYIQDILVHPDYQQQQIGSTLMTDLLEKYTNIRQKVLLTGDAPDVRHFYEKCGFDSCDQGREVAFYQEY